MSSEPASSSSFGYASGLKGADLSKWLENKLGPSDDLWCSRNICAHLSQEILANCQTCFVDLQTSVKLKLLLSLIHMGKRNLELWREEIEDIINLASQDADDWVQTIAELLRDFPTTNAVNFVAMEENSNHFSRALDDLKDSLGQIAKESHLLPLESTYMNKPALLATFGPLPPPVKHFGLKRKSKAAALRSDLLTKASDAASHVKTKGVGVSSVVPIRPRAMAKVNNTAPLKGLPQNVLKTNSQFTASRSSVRPSAPKREGGIKLLDDLPMTLKNRRKSAKAAELLAKEKEKKSAAEVEICENSDRDELVDSIINDVVSVSTAVPVEDESASTPTIVVAEKRRRSKTEAEPKAKRSRKVAVAESVEEEIILPTANVVSSPVAQPTVIQTQMGLAFGPAVKSDLSAAMATAQSVLAQNETGEDRISVIIKPTEPHVNTPQHWPRQPQYFGSQPIPFGTAILPGTQPYFMSTPTSTPVLSTPATNFSQPPAAAFYSPLIPAGHSQQSLMAPPVAKPMLRLSEEVMIAAQEMFKTANKLSRPEKALILGFMAGSRDNPCPHMGQVLTVRLSERLELIKADLSEQQQSVVVEDFFQMNYATGEWKKLSKSRPLKPGELLNNAS